MSGDSSLRYVVGQWSRCLWVELKYSSCSCSCVYMPPDTDLLSTAAWLVSHSAMSFVPHPECPRLHVPLGGFPLGSWWVKILILFLTAEPLQASFMPRHMPKTFPHHSVTCLKFLHIFLPVVMPLKPALSFPSPLSSPPPPLAWATAIASQLSLCSQSFPKLIHPINAVRGAFSNTLA